MSPQQGNDRPEDAPGHFLSGAEAPLSSSRIFLRFFFWLLLIPAAFYLTAIPLVRLPAYERWGPSHWGPVLDFAFHTEGQNADVVIFGDSSAFLGIDPRLVDRQLGIKSVVLPNTVGSLPVIGDAALEFYFAHNHKPRLIVLYFTAWDLDFGASHEEHLFEGEEMLLRYGSARQIFAFARAHPLELPVFPLREYSSMGPGVLRPLIHGDDRRQATIAARGHVEDDEPYFSLQPGCSIPQIDLDAHGSATVQALVSKYTARGFRIVVYLAPIPQCVNAGPLTSRTFNGVGAAPPAALPAPSFLNDGLFAHVEPSSVPVASTIFANTIAPLLNQ